MKTDPNSYDWIAVDGVNVQRRSARLRVIGTDQ